MLFFFIRSFVCSNLCALTFFSSLLFSTSFFFFLHLLHTVVAVLLLAFISFHIRCFSTSPLFHVPFAICILTNFIQKEKQQQKWYNETKKSSLSIIGAYRGTHCVHDRVHQVPVKMNCINLIAFNHIVYSVSVFFFFFILFHTILFHPF